MLGIETDQWLTSVIYFDDEYQTIQSIADLYPSGIEITSNDHDFMGNVIQTKVKQTIGSNVYEYNKWFDFDSYGRLQQVSQQITGDNTNNKVILAKYTYDELGNIATKAIHNEKQTESYTYDLTGRTISVTSPSFSYALDYEESPISSAIPRLDGNICAMRWGSSTTPNKAYTYTYDHVGQLQSADYKLLSNNVWNNSSNYKEGGLTYDLNGNILTVQRTNSSGAQLHNIAYTYEGYRLKTVNVNNVPSAAYAYDSNGNMISDGRRGITVSYNILDLPEQIVAGNQQISYIYSTSGEKLATNANGSLTYYRSVMVYGNDNKLLYLLTPEGTATRTEGSAGTSYTYNYFKTDHLGSTRVMLSAVNGTLQASQTTDFYPFGLAFEYSNLNKNKYLFSGKELQDGALGNDILGWYDFGARFYDPILGRWFNVDPAAQVANPYLFCGNAPMMYIDKDGQLFWLIPVLGAAIGGWLGGSAANKGQLNPFKWHWNSASTWLGFLGGAVAGAYGAFVGASIAASNIFMSNTLGLMAGSLVSSTGLTAATGGMIQPSISMGFASYSFNNTGWGYLGKQDNNIIENILYSISGLVNIYDIYSAFHVNEIGGDGSSLGKSQFIDNEEIPTGARPTLTGRIASTSSNPNYGSYGLTRNKGTKPHFGIDFEGNVGDEVYAMYDGKVIRIGSKTTLGKYNVRISSVLNNQHYNVDYGHLSKALVKVGQEVKAGDRIGLMGRIGYENTSYPTHVHVQIWRMLPAFNCMGFVKPMFK